MKKTAAKTEEVAPTVTEETDLSKLSVEDRIKRGEEIIAGAINDLKEKRKDLEKQIAEVDKMLAKYGAPSAPKGDGETTGSRVKSEDFEAAVFGALAGGKELGHPEIKASQQLVEAYKKVGKEVPNVFIQLDKMVQANKLIKVGKGKSAKYKMAPSK